MRRNARPKDRRYWSVQDYLRGRHLRRASPHRSHYRPRLPEYFKREKDKVAHENEELRAGHRTLEKQIEQLKDKLAGAQVGSLEQQARVIKTVTVLAAEAPGWIARSSASWPIRCETNGRARWWCWRRRKIQASPSSRLSPKILPEKCTPENWSVRWRRPWAGRAADVPTWPRPAGKIPKRSLARWRNVYATVEGML